MCEERGLVSRAHGDFKNSITAFNALSSVFQIGTRPQMLRFDREQGTAASAGAVLQRCANGIKFRNR
jgi:hypothetical protein